MTTRSLPARHTHKAAQAPNAFAAPGGGASLGSDPAANAPSA